MTEPSSSVTFPALGTTAVVAVVDPAALEHARLEVEAVVEAFDLACSRFRDDSEVRALRAAAGAPAPVSTVLFDAIAASLRAAQLTEGDVDPTVGSALIALGYDRDFAAVGAGGSVARQIRVAQVPGWRTLTLDPDARIVTVPPGVELDLGATAKALAADRAAAAAASRVGCGVLASLGGDLAVAGPAPHDGWRVRVTDDHRDGVDAPGQWVAIRSGGLATSSTTARRWETGSGPAHHLVNPASGRPADGRWRTVSVAAASCLDANIASTAAIVRGDRALGWLQSLGLPSRLVGVDGTVRHVAGWPSDGDDLRATEGGLA